MNPDNPHELIVPGNRDIRRTVRPCSFLEWLARRGYRVIQTASSYWYEGGPRVYQAFPYHRLINPDKEELNQLFGRYKAIALRYSTPLCSPQGIISYHVIYSGQEYHLSVLPKKARSDVRKGLRFVSIGPVSFGRLAAEGWQARAETLLRQGRSVAENRAKWAKLCRSAAGLPGFEAWGAFSNGEIVASLIAFTDEDCCTPIYQQSLTGHLRNRVNNALTFRFTEEVLGRRGVSSIFLGLHTPAVPASVDDYKYRMRYAAKPVRQRVVFHPCLAPIFNLLKPSMLPLIFSRLRSMHPFFAMVEGFLSWYIHGRRPLTEQPWPECLAGRKEELIRSACSIPPNYADEVLT